MERGILHELFVEFFKGWFHRARAGFVFIKNKITKTIPLLQVLYCYRNQWMTKKGL